MKRPAAFLIAILVLALQPMAWAGGALAQPAAPPAAQVVPTPRLGRPAPVMFWNRQIAVFRSYYEEQGPAERAARTSERIAALPETSSSWNVVATQTTFGRYSGSIVTVNGALAMIIFEGDVDTESGDTLQSATDRATAELRAALEARAEQRRWPVLLKGIGLSLLATMVMFIAIWLLATSRRRVLARMDRVAANMREIGFGGYDLRPLLSRILHILVSVVLRGVALVAVYLWLTYVLLRFTYTQPWGHRLGHFLYALFTRLGAGFVRALPGLFTVLVIFILARIVSRLIDGIFGEVERGALKMTWLHPDTARATRRLVLALVWIFAVVVAYPYIPGSNTDAFKGVSVLVGLMISLGSAGLVNQAMSGLVIIYSRALAPGEYVSIDDDHGTVTEVGLLSTKLFTRKREEITIPNAVLVGTKMVNYSRHLPGEGTAVGTTITIGYDAPWRLVHEMLLKAAHQTEGMRKDPAPRVWQKALSDFYVEYELVFNLDDPEQRVPILSELHKHIQDAFNENAVQIMSPHFETQPADKVFVPKSEWFPTPAKENGEPEGKETSLTEKP